MKLFFKTKKHKKIILDKGFIKKNLSLCLVLSFLQGCTPTVDIHGPLLTDKMLSALQEGTYTKDQVADFLGPPSIVASFNDYLWIYIGKKTETTAFLEPLVLEEATILLQFDDKETLKGIYKIDMTKAIPLIPFGKTTPTGGHDISFLQELFGSFGLFHRPTGLEE
jgi:outer membrane protein assembly factor BamE (lipoprotein component of BamABCDE complex)